MRKGYSLIQNFRGNGLRLYVALIFSGFIQGHNINMSKNQLERKLRDDHETPMSPEQINPLPGPSQPSLSQQYDYHRTGFQPKLKLSNLSLCILGPILLVLHPLLSSFFHIPILQYIFVTSLTAFLINYLGIIRHFQLYPYLPQPALDNRLKVCCVITFVGLLMSIYFGWNGSGGMIFAMFWEVTRGQRMNLYGIYFAAIIVGSLLMQQNYSWSKLLQFIPGILLGWVNSQIFKLRQSNYYTLTHQLLFLSSITLPIFFPATDMIVPSIWQWGLMICSGILMLLTVIIMVRLMQMVRVSVVVGVTAGVLMIGTSKYHYGREYVGMAMIVVGILLLGRTEFRNDM